MDFKKNLPIIYGTAWKGDKTDALVYEALTTGFRGVDTAGQPKHYDEKLCGDGIKRFLTESTCERKDVFVQTKFTYPSSQDKSNMPYDPQASPEEQVAASFASSLKNLQTTYVDSYMLHGPWSRYHFCDMDMKVWTAMEKLYESGQVKALGISNVCVDQLTELLTKVKVKPSYLQNRCFSTNSFDKEIRDLCKANDIVYQGFSLLTANQCVVFFHSVKGRAAKHDTGSGAVVMKFARQLGMLPLTGTTNATHMKQDLSAVTGTELDFTDAELFDLEHNFEDEDQQGHPGSDCK